MKKSLAFAASIAALFAVSGTAQAADLDTACVQAVSGFNGKIEGAAGFIDQDVAIIGGPVVNEDGARFHGAGSLSLPLGCMLGVQVDAAAGDIAGQTFVGGAAHVFMRDPSSYLVGVHGMYTNIDNALAPGDNDIWRVGPEVEFYLNNFSIEAWAGLESSDSNGEDFFATVDLAMYATEDLRLNVGFRRFLDINAFAAGAEWQVSDTMPVSLFVEGQFGENDYATVFGGVKFYFGGEQKSLIRRHREDDPRNRVPDLVGFGQAAGNGIGGPEDSDCTEANPCIRISDPL
jgi:hypothetical protein